MGPRYFSLTEHRGPDARRDEVVVDADALLVDYDKKVERVRGCHDGRLSVPTCSVPTLGYVMTDSSEHIQKKHVKPWYKHTTTLISLGAMMIALISAGISAYQVNLARQSNIASAEQNVATEQQELVTLVADIAQDPATVSQETLTLGKNASAISQEQSSGELTELADAEEATSIVRLLNGNGVTAAEYYSIALGLEVGESYGQALDYLGTAVKLPADPRIHASILRLEAAIYYSLDRPAAAELDDELAAQSFNHIPDVTEENLEANVAFTDLWDAYYQIPISCSRALTDVESAARIILVLIKVESSTTLASMTAEVQNDYQELHLRSCAG